jgi:hypothetical protein
LIYISEWFDSLLDLCVLVIVSFVDSLANETNDKLVPRNQCGHYAGLDFVHANSFKRALDGSKRFVLSLRHTNQVLILDENYTVTHVAGVCSLAILFIFALIVYSCLFIL